MIEFEESGMRFAFEEAKSFHIEHSSAYQKLRGKGVKCVLVVKGYETEWCQKMAELIRHRLHGWLKLWKAEVWVLTEHQAQRKKLVQCGEN